LLTADPLELVFGVSQQLCNNPLFGFTACTVEHVPVLSYPEAKTLNIIREAGDRLGFLCKFQRSSRKRVPDARVSTSFRFVKKPTNLGS
jgi:hypothetical protein